MTEGLDGQIRAWYGSGKNAWSTLMDYTGMDAGDMFGDASKKTYIGADFSDYYGYKKWKLWVKVNSGIFQEIETLITLPDPGVASSFFEFLETDDFPDDLLTNYREHEGEIMMMHGNLEISCKCAFSRESPPTDPDDIVRKILVTYKTPWIVKLKDVL